MRRPARWATVILAADAVTARAAIVTETYTSRAEFASRLEDVTGGGNATEVTFVVGDAPALVPGFGTVFVDPDTPSVSCSPSSATKASRSATPRSPRRTASASSAASSRSTPTPACRYGTQRRTPVLLPGLIVSFIFARNAIVVPVPAAEASLMAR